MEVTRDEFESLIAEALLREGTFRPKRRNWSETRSEDERRARIIAAAIVTFLYGWGEAACPAGAPDAWRVRGFSNGPS